MMMKAGAKRVQRPGRSGKQKPCCGTISHIAECRGIVRKAAATAWQSPGTNRLVRKYPAVV